MVRACGKNGRGKVGYRANLKDNRERKNTAEKMADLSE